MILLPLRKAFENAPEGDRDSAELAEPQDSTE
jgi:hypothetical protein